MKKYNETTVVIHQADYERIKEGVQTEVYLDIEQKHVKKLISEEGYKNLVIKSKRDNALINAVLAAWDLGYAAKFQRISLRCGVSGKIMTCKVKNVLIKTGNPDWCTDPTKLCFVVKLGEIIKLVEG